MKINEELATKISHEIPKYSHGRDDLLPIFSHYELFNEIVEHLVEPFVDKVDVVCALEATGWILGTAMAQRLGVSFIPIRKGGKLPYDEEMIESVSLVDYSHETKKLCLKKEAIPFGSRILLVDEWIETGAQLEAALNLLAKFPCEVVAATTISIRQQPDKVRNLKWIEEDFIHAVGTNIRRYEN